MRPPHSWNRIYPRNLYNHPQVWYWFLYKVHRTMTAAKKLFLIPVYPGYDLTRTRLIQIIKNRHSLCCRQIKGGRGVEKATGMWIFISQSWFIFTFLLHKLIIVSKLSTVSQSISVAVRRYYKTFLCIVTP